MVEAAGEDGRIRVTGAEAKRVKREALGVPDRAKHQQRVAVPMRRRTPEADTRQRVYRYRCYPSPAQSEQLVKTFGACRWTYNEGLALRDKAWREHRVALGFAESCRALIRLAERRGDAMAGGGFLDGSPAGAPPSRRRVRAVLQGLGQTAEA
ncbi:helix-turn-helix domain-containing protein [Streptomyces sp. NPDC094466]|uniref:helix-turn-helix domain-containing protein n=1 Tax=Streptomyces sp. NPDC094466 TaxID=3366065 RepID=UPI00380B22D6